MMIYESSFSVIILILEKNIYQLLNHIANQRG